MNHAELLRRAATCPTPAGVVRRLPDASVWLRVTGPLLKLRHVRFQPSLVHEAIPEQSVCDALPPVGYASPLRPDGVLPFPHPRGSFVRQPLFSRLRLFVAQPPQGPAVAVVPPRHDERRLQFSLSLRFQCDGGFLSRLLCERRSF